MYEQTPNHSTYDVKLLIIIIPYIDIALFWVLKALYMEGGVFSTLTRNNIK